MIDFKSFPWHLEANHHQILSSVALANAVDAISARTTLEFEHIANC